MSAVMNVQKRVIAIIAEQGLLDAGAITPDARLADLGIDSLGVVEAIFAIEEAFDVAVPFNANEPGVGFDITTVGSLIAAVQGLIAQRAA
jgi:acyl carrier protein